MIQNFMHIVWILMSSNICPVCQKWHQQRTHIVQNSHITFNSIYWFISFATPDSKRMIWHCVISYKCIIPLCHHHHQKNLSSVITLQDNKIIMMNRFMKCVTHKFQDHIYHNQNQNVISKVCQFTNFVSMTKNQND